MSYQHGAYHDQQDAQGTQEHEREVVVVVAHS